MLFKPQILFQGETEML